MFAPVLPLVEVHGFGDKSPLPAALRRREGLSVTIWLPARNRHRTSTSAGGNTSACRKEASTTLPSLHHTPTQPHPIPLHHHTHNRQRVTFLKVGERWIGACPPLVEDWPAVHVLEPYTHCFTVHLTVSPLADSTLKNKTWQTHTHTKLSLF